MFNLRFVQPLKFFLPLFLLVLALPGVFAFIPHIVTDTLSGWFSAYPEHWVRRAMLCLLLFALLYYVLSGILKSKDRVSFKGVRITVAVTLALMMGLFMPAGLVDMIFLGMGGLVGLLIFAMLVVGFMYVGIGLFPKNSFGYGVRAVWYLLGIVVVSAFLPGLPYWSAGGFSLRSIAEILVFVFFILAVVNAAKAIFGDSKESGEAGFHWPFGKKEKVDFEKPEKPGDPERPNDTPSQFPPVLTALENSNTQFRDLLRVFFNQGNSILSGTPQDWDRTAKQLCLSAEHYNTVLETGFLVLPMNKMTADDQGRFVRILNFRAQCINAQVRYLQEFQSRIISGDATAINITLP